MRRDYSFENRTQGNEIQQTTKSVAFQHLSRNEISLNLSDSLLCFYCIFDFLLNSQDRFPIFLYKINSFLFVIHIFHSERTSFVYYVRANCVYLSRKLEFYLLYMIHLYFTKPLPTNRDYYLYSFFPASRGLSRRNESEGVSPSSHHFCLAVRDLCYQRIFLLPWK